MPISLGESQAAIEIAEVLYDFLPGNPHPYADQRISFAGIAANLGLSDLWSGGSKRPAITTLLESTLASRRSQFCPLVLEVVRRGLNYRSQKGNPVTRDEIKLLNGLITRVGFKVPELWDSSFLESLPFIEDEPDRKDSQLDLPRTEHLVEQLLGLERIEAHPRGFAFEAFLIDLFAVFDLDPLGSFRLVGEQIDGSLQLDGHTYLIEARWRKQQAAASDLFVFQNKVEGKSKWSRGLFISYSGFSADGQEAFSKGRSTSIIGMDGQDLYFVLRGEISLPEAIRLKSRRAAETGRFLVTVQELTLKE